MQSSGLPVCSAHLDFANVSLRVHAACGETLAFLSGAGCAYIVSAVTSCTTQTAVQFSSAAGSARNRESQPTASTMTSSGSTRLSGLPGDGPDATDDQSTWRRSMPPSKRTTENRDHHKQSTAQCPTGPGRRSNPSVRNRPGRANEGRTWRLDTVFRYIPHYRHAPAARRFSAVPYPQ